MLTDFNAELALQQQQGLYRRRRIVEAVSGVELIVDGKPCLNFCSNDYLGLSQHPQLKAALQHAVSQYPLGSGSAHLICGHSHAHHALEEELAAFTGREKAVLFSTGYMANVGVISALCERGDWVLQDRLNHASLLDGALLSKARLQRYRHRNMADLKAKLSKAPGDVLLVSDGVFSMDGDLAPLPEMVGLTNTRNSLLMIDDAHGMAVLGRTGAGVVEHFELAQQDVPILMGTLGKGFGCFGAFVAGSEALIELLIQKARSYIYTTALPPTVCEATRVSLRLVQGEIGADKRAILQQNIAYFKQSARQIGLSLMPSDTAIQPLLIGDSQQALAISQQLWARGLWVSAIRPPTVPKGQARLRITLSALHQTQHIDTLLDALAHCLQ
ncbi:8-amino-7-oxononanoate synthase [methane-oxidizing endosymbiont of Gigantopelta aegis]|uniref:8-amino-7-oxononanoate synthase n=1 Tax=methane-oxidizing endosymbiont of Gigantopelta aegis TaxID=2794938 RepID=UPI0018DB54A6|nr:8-amino-7-oxononanoate synthase [methane-oxidizing endosymbiont of Gigantopelta aegis]